MEDLDFIDTDYLDPMFGLENFEGISEEQINAFVVFCFATTAMRSGAKMYFEWFPQLRELLYPALEKIGNTEMRNLVASYEKETLSDEDDINFHKQIDPHELYSKTLLYAREHLSLFQKV